MVVAVAVVLVLLRSAVFVFWEQAAFDSDQAIVGLMAKHLAEGRAFPLFYYGQNYLLGVEAWLAAPLFLLAGASVAALKLPLVVINLAVALLLIHLLERHASLRPLHAGVAALFFVLAPPGTASQLLTALGVSVEPFLYVLLIWMFRARPVWLGVVLGFGSLHREFTAYGFLALLMTEAGGRSLFTRKRAAQLAVSAAVVVVVWLAVGFARPYSSAAGPGTSPADVVGASNGLAGLAARVCGDAGLMLSGVYGSFTSYPGLLLGLTPTILSDFWVNSTLTQGLPGTWPVLAIACLCAVARCVWLWVRRTRQPAPGSLSFSLYLLLTGAVTLAGYGVGRCGDLHVLTMRYALLGVLGPIGLVALVLQVEPRRWVRTISVGVVAAWAVVSAAGHVQLANEYLTRTPPNYRRVLADYLIAHRMRYARADYWTAYHVAFLANERVIVATQGVPRIASYQQRVNLHERDAVQISRTPCADGRGAEAVPRVYWVCEPPR